MARISKNQAVIAEPASPASASPQPTGAASRQATKSAAMRRRLCEAATDCFATGGYHGTSIKAVVDASGASHGALQHHFPTKLDLTAATAEFLLGKSIRWFAAVKQQLAGSPQGLAEALRRSWREQFRSPDYAALLEILIAARTDDDLKTRVAPALEAWRTSMDEELAALDANGEDGEAISAHLSTRLKSLLTIGRAMMTGLLVHDTLLDDDPQLEATLEAWLQLATEALENG